MRSKGKYLDQFARVIANRRAQTIGIYYNHRRANLKTETLVRLAEATVQLRYLYQLMLCVLHAAHSRFDFESLSFLAA